MGNWFKTTLLMAALTALIVFIGNLLGGQNGMILAFVLAVGMNFFSYWFSDKIVLRMYKAQEVTPSESPELHQIVAGLAQRANCRCRASTSFRKTRPMPLPRAGTRNMRWSL